MTHTWRRRSNNSRKRNQRPWTQRPSRYLKVCERCGEEVMMVAHAGTGKQCPLDLKRRPEANLFIDGDAYRVLTPKSRPFTLDEARERGLQLFLNHLIVCQKEG